MKTAQRFQFNSWLNLPRVALLCVSPFLLLFLLVVFAGSLYLLVQEPQRIVLRQISTNELIIVSPQPVQLSLADTNVLVDPLLPRYNEGADIKSAIWVNGKAFDSGWGAVWELVKSVWPLYLVGVATLISVRSSTRHRPGARAPLSGS